MFRLSRDGRFPRLPTPRPELLTLPSDTILGSSVYDIPPERIAPEAIRERMALAERAFATGEVQTQEYEIWSPDGETLYSEARIVPSGENEFVMIVRDVTDRVIQQRQIETQNEFLEAMGDATTGLLCNLHLDGRIGRTTSISRCASSPGTRSTRSTAATSGMSSSHLRTEPTAERVVKEVVAGGDPGEQQSRWLTKDGHEVIVAWTCRPMPTVHRRGAPSS